MLAEALALLHPAATDGGGCAPQAPLQAHLQCRQGWGSARCLARCPCRLVPYRGAWCAPGRLPSAWHWCRGWREPHCLSSLSSDPSGVLPGSALLRHPLALSSLGLSRWFVPCQGCGAALPVVPLGGVMWQQRLLRPPFGIQSHPGCAHGICSLGAFFLLSRELLEWDLWDRLRNHHPRSTLTCLEESRRPRGTGQAE